MEKSEIIDRLNGLKRLIGNMENPPFPADVPGDIEALGAASDFIRRAEPENKALTLEQLKQMDGELVYIPETEAYLAGHGSVNVREEKVYQSNGDGDYYPFDEYGSWLAYAHKPEGSETDGRTD